MQKYWPSYASNSDDESFWSHEWTKHGTCAIANRSEIPSQSQYFQDSLAARQRYAPLANLEQGGIFPSDTKVLSTSTVMSVLQQGYGKRVGISCDSDGFLETVTVCLTADQDIFDCPSSVTANQCGSTLVFPATSSAASNSTTRAL
jgi:ribonuclease T2